MILSPLYLHTEIEQFSKLIAALGAGFLTTGVKIIDKPKREVKVTQR